MSASDVGSLQGYPEFKKLWAGQTVSVLGSQVSLLAVPLTAVLVLRAGPIETGLLTAAGYAPMLLFGLLAGAWVDRWQRRPVLIGSDLGRALLLASIPSATVLGVLHIEQLYVVAFASGTLAIFSSLAGVAYLPGLVGREHLVQANSRLQGSASVAQIVGPAIGGGLAQAVSAPLAILADAASFVVSAVAVWTIRATEIRGAAVRRGIGKEIGEGLRWVRGDAIVFALMTGAAITNWSLAAVQALYVLYVTRELGLSPAIVGLLLGVAGPASLLAAGLAGRLSVRFGFGRTILIAILAEAVARFLVPTAEAFPQLTIPLLVIAQTADGFAGPTFNINSVSVRQALAPDHLQGRVNAAARTIALSTAPAGALMAGWLGEAVGLRTALSIAALVTLSGLLRMILSPLLHLRGLPAPVSDHSARSMAKPEA